MIESIYRLSLRLYPSLFRDEFGDEMLDTFLAHIEDGDNSQHKMNIIAKELVNSLWYALLLHVDATKHGYTSLSDELQTVYQARWIIRIGSFLNALFMVLVTLEPYAAKPEPENLVMLVLFTMQLVCVFFALKWERIGGIIMLTTTLTITPMLFMSVPLPGYEYLLVFGALLWALPFGCFAIAYIVLGQREATIRQRALA